MPQSNDLIPSSGWGSVFPVASGGVFRVQNNGGAAVIVQAFPSLAAANAAAGDGPAAGGVTVYSRDTGALLMATAFPGVANATHLRAFCPFGGSTLAVSYA